MQSLIKDEKPHLIMIDQFKAIYSDKEIQKINELIQSTQVKIIVCSSINEREIRKNLIEQWLNKKELNSPYNYHYYPENAYVQLPEENNDVFLKEALAKFNYIPKYYELFKKYGLSKDTIAECIDETKKRILKNIKTFLVNEEQLMKLYVLSDSKLNIEITIEELANIIDIIPLKYFILKKHNDKFIIQPHFPIINEIIKEDIDMTLQAYSHKFYSITKFVDNRAFLGNLFEFIVHLQFRKGSLAFNTFYINNVIKVRNLITLINKNERTRHILNQVTNVYLTPIQQNAKMFDSGILIKNPMTGNKLLYFQITIHKTDAKIYSLEEIRKEFKTIKDKIKEVFDVTIEENNFYFMYILLHDEQNISDMLTSLQEKKIPYIFFSIQQLQFLDSNSQVINELKIKPVFGKIEDTLFDSIELTKDNTILQRKREREKRNSYINILSKNVLEQLKRIYNAKYIVYQKELESINEINNNCITVFITKNGIYAYNPKHKQNPFIKINENSIMKIDTSKNYKLMVKLMINKSFISIHSYTISSKL